MIIQDKLYFNHYSSKQNVRVQERRICILILGIKGFKGLYRAMFAQVVPLRDYFC